MMSWLPLGGIILLIGTSVEGLGVLGILILLLLDREIMLMASMCLLADLMRSMKRST